MEAAPVPPIRFVQCLAEILAVCKKYGVVLSGTCHTEGIYGEIEFNLQEEMDLALVQDFAEMNQLQWQQHWQAWYVTDIGQLTRSGRIGGITQESDRTVLQIRDGYYVIAPRAPAGTYLLDDVIAYEPYGDNYGWLLSHTRLSPEEDRHADETPQP